MHNKTVSTCFEGSKFPFEEWDLAKWRKDEILDNDFIFFSAIRCLTWITADSFWREEISLDKAEILSTWPGSSLEII